MPMPASTTSVNALLSLMSPFAPIAAQPPGRWLPSVMVKTESASALDASQVKFSLGQGGATVHDS